MALSTENYSLQQGLTYSTLFDFFCSDSENVEDLTHYCCDRVHHSLIWHHFSVCVQTAEKCFYAFKHLIKGVLVRANVLCCLRFVHITMDRTKVLRKVHTERRTVNPITITFAGGNTCQINKYERVDLGQSSCSEAYRADTFSECLWEGMNNVHRWVQPLHIAALRLIELLDLLLKRSENTASRIAGFETVGEWVREKIFLCAFFVCFQCIIEN